jgi:hypothetical protein
MIRAVGWSCNAHHGCYVPAAISLLAPSPGNPGEGRGEGLNKTNSVGVQEFSEGPHPNPLPDYRERGQEAKSGPAEFDRSVKNIERFTDEARHGYHAARAAMRDFPASSPSEIGLLVAGSDGLLAAQEKYFHDYVINGRTLGRANLFIYTLATSVAGEIAIALSLTGPCLFIRGDARPVESLVKQAEQMLDDREADGILAIWSDSQAAACLAIARDQPTPALPDGWETEPLALCNLLRNTVQTPQ